MSDFANPLKRLDIVYSAISSGGIKHGERETFLGNKNNKVCRFCGKTEKETTFKTKAHAFPQFVGNTKLLSYYECDCCNKFFSEDIEDHFAKYFMTFNTLTGVKGNKKIPAYKSKDEATRIEAISENVIHVHTVKDSEAFTVEEVENGYIIKVKYEYQPFIPIAVHKCFVKMALTVMPEEYLQEFADTISWLMESEHINFYKNNRRLMLKFALLNNHLDSRIIYGLYKNEKPCCLAPYMLFYISWGQAYCLIEVPSYKNNNCIEITDLPLLLRSTVKVNSIKDKDLTCNILL